MFDNYSEYFDNSSNTFNNLMGSKKKRGSKRRTRQKRRRSICRRKHVDNSPGENFSEITIRYEKEGSGFISFPKKVLGAWKRQYRSCVSADAPMIETFKGPTRLFESVYFKIAKYLEGLKELGVLKKYAMSEQPILKPVAPIPLIKDLASPVFSTMTPSTYV